VDEFFYQATLREKDLYPENFHFSIQFGETENTIGGFCNTKARTITINPEDWEHRDHEEREHIIFHELGHCILNRDHRNEETLSNECFSYLRGDENDFDCSLNLLSAYWRDYYLEELFDPGTPLPLWYLANQDFNLQQLHATDSLVIGDTLISELELTTLRFSQRDTFVFEITFKNIEADVKSVGFYIGNLLFQHCNTCTTTNTSLQLGNTRIFATPGPNLSGDIRFSVFRNKDVISFFINDHFMHAMEFSIIEGNRFKTKYFEEETWIDLQYFFN
jgi:hypothetical protein